MWFEYFYLFQFIVEVVDSMGMEGIFVCYFAVQFTLTALGVEMYPSDAIFLFVEIAIFLSGLN